MTQAISAAPPAREAAAQRTAENNRPAAGTPDDDAPADAFAALLGTVAVAATGSGDTRDATPATPPDPGPPAASPVDPALAGALGLAPPPPTTTTAAPADTRLPSLPVSTAATTTAPTTAPSPAASTPSPAPVPLLPAAPDSAATDDDAPPAAGPATLRLAAANDTPVNRAAEEAAVHGAVSGTKTSASLFSTAEALAATAAGSPSAAAPASTPDAMPATTPRRAGTDVAALARAARMPAATGTQGPGLAVGGAGAESLAGTGSEGFDRLLSEGEAAAGEPMFNGNVPQPRAASAVDWLLDVRSMSAELDINTPDSEPVHIRLSLDGDEVQADIQCADAATREALQFQAPHLREQLAGNGLVLARLDVATAGGQSAGDPGSGAPGQDPRGQHGTKRSGDDPAPATHRGRRDGLLDEYA